MEIFMPKVKSTHIAAAALGGPGTLKSMAQEAVHENIHARAERLAAYVEQYIQAAHDGKEASLPIDSMNPNQRDEAKLAEAVAKELLAEKSNRPPQHAAQQMIINAFAPGAGMKQSLELHQQDSTNERATRMLSRMRKGDYAHNGMMDVNGEYEARLAEALKAALEEKNIVIQETKWADFVRQQSAARGAVMSH
jgi:hypothetical protein